MDRHEIKRQEANRNLNFQQLERQGRQLDDQLERNKKQLQQIEKAEQIFIDVQVRKQNQLEELSHNWKGEHARSVLSESMMNHQTFQRQQLREIHERKHSYTESNRTLYQKQAELERSKRSVVRGGR